MPKLVNEYRESDFVHCRTNSYLCKTKRCLYNIASKETYNIQKEQKVMKKEKVKRTKVGAARQICWQSSSISSGCMLMVQGFISIYCTDTMGMPAALVGTLLMVSKIFDGFTDLIAGYVVDNTRSRWGKGTKGFV